MGSSLLQYVWKENLHISESVIVFSAISAENCDAPTVHPYTEVEDFAEPLKWAF